jgi:hypothetical protein
MLVSENLSNDSFMQCWAGGEASLEAASEVSFVRKDTETHPKMLFLVYLHILAEN